MKSVLSLVAKDERIDLIFPEACVGFVGIPQCRAGTIRAVEAYQHPKDGHCKVYYGNRETSKSLEALAKSKSAFAL